MAQIEQRLSTKVQKDTGMCEVLIRFFQGSKFNLRAKSGVFVSPEYFEYYIDRAKTESLGVKVPGNLLTATEEKAKKSHYVLRQSGIIVIKQRIETPEVKYHREQSGRLDSLRKAIIEAYDNNKDANLTSDWLQLVVERFMHPEKYIVKAENKKTFYELTEEYIEKRHLAYTHAKVFRVLMREVARYEGFIRATDYNRSNFTFDIDTVTKSDIEDFIDYLRHEYTLSMEHKDLFKKLLSEYPASVTKGNCKLEDRGENTVIKGAKRLKSLFRWFYEEEYTKNRPFDGINLGTEKVGTPYYITIEERNKIAETDFVAAYENMSEEERKGIDKSEQSMQARVPLHPKALELVKKYEGVCTNGLLFPFITAQKYNIAIKKIFKLAGITRNVIIRNAKTGENELVPIDTVASSHLARRTFIGNAYFKVSDPNLIGKMSGHVDGSRAFKRYRNIEDETLKSVIDLIG